MQGKLMSIPPPDLTVIQRRFRNYYNMVNRHPKEYVFCDDVMEMKYEQAISPPDYIAAAGRFCGLDIERIYPPDLNDDDIPF